MICFTLRCYNSHEFDAWFRDSEAYETQQKQQLISCPQCGILDVTKAIMAPNIIPSSKSMVAPEQFSHKLRELKTYVTSNFENVGKEFPEEARRIHDGESLPRSIYGKATPEQAQDLMDDGIDLYILPDVPTDS